MKKIKIRDKEYNCSNRVYWHIKGLKSENECFNMEIKSHEQSEYDLQQENKQLKARIDKAVKYLEEPNRDKFDISYAKMLEILKGEKNENTD